MAIQDEFTDRFLDLTVATFSPQGSPPVADDQHNTGVTFDYDGSTQFSTTAIKPIDSGVDHTIAWWAFVETAATGANMMVSQNGAGAAAVNFTMSFDATGEKMSAKWATTAADFLLTTSPTGSVLKNAWNFFVVTIDGTTNSSTSIKIYQNGPEVSSYFQRIKVAGGYTGPSATNPPLILGSMEPAGSNFLEGRDSRLYFYKNRILNATEAQALFDFEFGAIGEAPVDSMFLDESAYLNGSTYPNSSIYKD